MAEKKVAKIDGQEIGLMTGENTPASGSAGVQSQLNGQASTVSGIANATGGIDGGNLIQPDVDEELFAFNAGDTPLMQIVLKAKRVKVESPMVDHYIIDEPRAKISTSDKVDKGAANQFILPLSPKDQGVPRIDGTLSLKGVDAYAPDGKTIMPGQNLQLYILGRDTATNNPIVTAVNGPKAAPTDEVCTTPAIPAGTEVIIMGNALYETQKHVEPDTFVPQPIRLNLQKRGMNSVVSNYLDAQRKRIPFAQAVIAEQQIKKYKLEGNRTFWGGALGMLKRDTGKMGMQTVYFSMGIRWMFKRELQAPEVWTVEKFIALSKMYNTGEDKPNGGILLAGKNLLEKLQCIDYSKHPEIKISVEQNTIGWVVTRAHTVFGDFDIKHEPTLDKMGWSNSGALICLDRVVHYVYSQEHSFSEDVEGEEAKRNGLLTWEAPALKGTCHIWIDGEGETAAPGYLMWDKDTVPTGKDLVDGTIYYLMKDVPGIAKGAKAGELWLYKGTKWMEYSAELTAK